MSAAPRLLRSVAVVGLIACGSDKPQPATIANRPGAPADEPASVASCKALVEKQYKQPETSYVNPQTGGKIIITETDTCGLIVEPVYFARNSTSLQTRTIDDLAGMLACLDQTDEVRFRLELAGHASDDEHHPDELALARAQAVERYLVECKVPMLGTSPRSAGNREPRDAGSTEHARAKNRRVDFLVLERQGPND